MVPIYFIPNYRFNYLSNNFYIFKSKTIREFDSNYTIKLFGHESVEEYYKVASLHDKLDRIKVPCLCLNAADDPFCLEHGKYYKLNLKNFVIEW